jgi:hypothetical protein
MKTGSNNTPPVRKWGLIDLLAMSAGMAPLLATIAALRHSGGSFVVYLLGVPSAIAIGIAILWAEGKLIAAIASRTKDLSQRIKNTVGISVLMFQLGWIFIGGAIGFRLAAFIGNRLRR